ncbi:hypothetical protein B0H63DRAFT_463211 [Podospora didyma]|uniref:Uncharacterized protein n=1 Tax=Podospora didyma TaxID=330526 RepID=A0AAE0U3G3_9PEZI|nr:hypothetical protein B0H63DRAFT_463211 [Podospora didyma]
MSHTAGCLPSLRPFRPLALNFPLKSLPPRWAVAPTVGFSGVAGQACLTCTDPEPAPARKHAQAQPGEPASQNALDAQGREKSGSQPRPTPVFRVCLVHSFDIISAGMLFIAGRSIRVEFRVHYCANCYRASRTSPARHSRSPIRHGLPR